MAEVKAHPIRVSLVVTQGDQELARKLLDEGLWITMISRAIHDAENDRKRIRHRTLGEAMKRTTNHEDVMGCVQRDIHAYYEAGTALSKLKQVRGWLRGLFEGRSDDAED